MFQICRMQLRQILGGRMKWLVVVILLLPVLLTLATVSGGGVEEIERELERAKLHQSVGIGEIPETARRVIWEGEDLSFADDRVTLTKKGLRLDGRRPRRNWLTVSNDGRLIISEGQLWIDDSKRPRDGRLRTRNIGPHSHDLGLDPEIPITMDTLVAIYLFLLYPQVICLLISLFYGTSVLGHELGGKTLTYLFTRPLPRWKFVVGKYLGIIVALTIPTCVSLLVSWWILGADGGFSVISGLLAGTVVALLAFNALFILFGFLIPRRAMIAALLYGVIFELILSFIPALVNQFTITYYVRSFVVEMLDIDIPPEAIRVVGGASPQGALVALAVITVGALAASSFLAARREYVIHDQA
jgi:ABC-type transport system involved in multi-copper enzyme maturation permease subunit